MAFQCLYIKNWIKIFIFVVGISSQNICFWKGKIIFKYICFKFCSSKMFRLHTTFYHLLNNQSGAICNWFKTVICKVLLSLILKMPPPLKKHKIYEWKNRFVYSEMQRVNQAGYCLNSSKYRNISRSQFYLSSKSLKFVKTLLSTNIKFFISCT